jgi:hypothetical protein
MIGSFAGCCARGEQHQAAETPNSVMNSRPSRVASQVEA